MKLNLCVYDSFQIIKFFKIKFPQPHSTTMEQPSQTQENKANFNIDEAAAAANQRCARNADSKIGTHANERSFKKWNAKTNAVLKIKNFGTYGTNFSKFRFKPCYF